MSRTATRKARRNRQKKRTWGSNGAAMPTYMPNHGHNLKQRSLQDAYRAAESGDFDTAITTIEEFLADTAELPTELRIHLMKTLVDWCAEDHRFAEARRHAARTARLAMEELGPASEMTMLARNADLYWKSMCGYEEIARAEYPKLLKEATATLGATHPITFAVRNNSAIPDKIAGDYDAAAEKYRILADDMRAHLGPEDVLVQTVYSNLGEAQALAGHLEESTDTFEALLADLLETTSPGDVMVLNTRYELASNYFEMGECQRARELWAVLREDCRRYLGDYHPLSMKMHMVELSQALAEGDDKRIRRMCDFLLSMPEDVLPDGWGDDLRMLVALAPSED